MTFKLNAAKRLLAANTEFVGAMANLNYEETGLSNLVVFINKKEGMRHACRVKVSNIRGKYSDDNFSIAMNGKVIGVPAYSLSEINQIRKWMSLNKEVILRYWNDPEYSVGGLLRDLKKI